MKLNKKEIRQLAEQIVKSVEQQDNTYDEIEVVENILSLYHMVLKVGATHEMKMENCAFTFKWDYRGWKKLESLGEANKNKNLSSEDGTWSQDAWNQTLITRINEISAHINKETHRGGASTLRMNPKLESIMETIPYYNEETKSFGARYKVIYDVSISNNEIFVHSDRWNNVVFISKVIEHKDDMNELTFKHHSEYSEEEQLEYNSKLIGCIIIDNLPEVMKPLLNSGEVGL